MRHYSINTMDSETTPTWMSIAAEATPAAQDSGKVRYDVAVESKNEKALFSALDADDTVIDYIETVPLMREIPEDEFDADARD